MTKFKALNNKIKNILSTLDEKIVSKIEKISWFTKLVSHFIEIFNHTDDSQLKNDEKYLGNALVYVRQIITSLSLLITIFVKEYELEVLLMEARKSVIKQINLCLENFESALTKNDIQEDNLGCFIKHVDVALEKVSDVNASKRSKQESLKEKCELAKYAILEVLTHAMVVAQIALEEDCRIIRGSSLSVFESMECLVNELSKETPNSAMVNLFKEACSDKICSLERRVNNAILKLSLKVFSEYTESIENIHKYCLENSNIENDSEMDNLVAEFDLNVDRITQIGLFAVSCTTDMTNGIRIKSCLMSIEALESELIPAFCAALVTRSVCNIQLALLLKDFWLRQMEILQQLVFRIIDPYAFCQTIYEENKIIIEKFSISIKESIIGGNESANNLLTILMKNTTVLQQFISTVIAEQQEDNTEQIKKVYKEFKEVFHEAKCAPSILYHEYSDHNKNNERILKRCKILLKMIKKLTNCFVDNNKSNSQENVSAEIVSTKERSPINYMDHNAFFNHIVNRGKVILKDRSNLCLSFERDLSLSKVQETTREQLKIDRAIHLTKLIHHRKLHFSQSNSKNDSNGVLQYTDIVNELNNLSQTFSVLSGVGNNRLDIFNK